MATVTGAVKGGMWLRPLHAIGKEEGDLRPGLWRGRNAVRRALLDVGVARMVDGTELHLLYMRPEDDKLTLAGKDHPALAEVLLLHKGVFDNPPLGLLPDSCIKLCLKTGNWPMLPSRLVKLLSAGELTKLDRQLHNLYEHSWIKCSTSGHAAAVVFVRKPDGSWHLCYHYQGLNTITEPLEEPLPHIDTLLEQTQECAFFSKISLALAYHQIRLRESDQWKTSFQSQLGQFQWKVVPFSLQGSSSVLMRVMNEAMTEGRKGASTLVGLYWINKGR